MKLINSVGLVGAITLLARCFGYARDMMISYYLGAGLLTDVFFSAFRIPNFLRRIFAEGAFSSAFVPLFAGKLEREGRESARTLAIECQSVMIVVLVAITILAVVFMHPLIWLFTPGFRSDPAKLEMTVLLTRITFPYLVFISLVALYGGVLNSMHKFAAFASAPILLNISLMLCLFFLLDVTATGAHALSYGVVLAGVAQVLWMLYFLKKMDFVIPLKKPRITENIKKLVTIMLPAIVGASVAQINLLVDTILGSYVESGISYLYYADRLCQLPLSVIGIAIGTVLLPTLSRHTQAGAHDKSRSALNRSLELALLLALPAAGALVCLADVIISVLFERGEFLSSDRTATANALIALSFGLPAFILVKILAPVFFAAQDTKTPVKIAIICIIANIVVSLILIKPMQHVGIALATSFSSWLNCALLAFVLHKRQAFEADERLKSKTVSILISSALMILSLLLLKFLVFGGIMHGVRVLFALLCYITVGSIVLICSCLATKAVEVGEIKQYFSETKVSLKNRRKK